VSTPPPFLIIGRVLRPHGVRGELRVQMLSSDLQRLANLSHVLIGHDPNNGKTLTRYEISNARRDRGYWLLSLANVTDRDMADRFRACYLCVPIEEASPLADDEIYIYQLIGLSVQTEFGEVLGNISEVLETGANDVYVVQGGPYGEILLPATHEVILAVLPEQNLLRVRLLPGLLPDSSDDSAE
jgi:16S rRNA processing protein RimM